MELQQIKALFANGQGAAGLHIHLDGVAVVQHFQRAFLVIHGQGVFGFFKRTNDVQRRLFFAFAANREVVTPVLRSFVAFIAPMHIMGFVILLAEVFFGFVFVCCRLWLVGGFFAIRQNLHILTSGCQGVLRRAHGLQTVAPLRHFQGFLEGRDGGFVLRTLGQQAQRGQTYLTFCGH